MKGKVIGVYGWIALWRVHSSLALRDALFLQLGIWFYKALYRSENCGRYELYIYLSLFALCFSSLSITAHSIFVLTIHAWVSLFHNCLLMTLISLPYILHDIQTVPYKIWDSKWSEFSSFNSIPSQQQIKTYATLLRWHSFFHLCWGNALEHIQQWH